MKKKFPSCSILASTALLAGMLTASAQTAVPASFAQSKDQANTSAPGFRVRVVQANNDSGTLPNSIARAESQLAGTLIDPVTSQPFVNVADPTPFGADGYYNETGVIDYEKGGNATAVIPGIPNPATPDYADNIALEALTYLDLAVGTYTMGVNSDDGFRVLVGSDPRDQFYAVKLGEWDGSRGATDTTFTFTITQAGVYGFRLIYEQGNSSANVSWFSGDVDNKILINDVNNPAAIKAYRELKTAPPPYIQLLNPGVDAPAALPNTSVNGVIVDGTAVQVTPSSLQLFLDGVKVEANPQKSGAKTTYSYKPATMLRPLSKHAVTLIFASSDSTVRTNAYNFTVAEFGNIVLPVAFWLETFDEVQEGTLPTGWTVENHTDQDSPGEDLNNPLSDSYNNWVVISKARVQAIGAAGGWDAAERLAVLAGQFVNGQEVTSLITNNFIDAESDQRPSGQSQIQYLFSPDVNCTGKTNVYLSYHSIYEQNQDSIGAVEYSIDGGATWLPVVYMVNAGDVLKDGSGNIDPVATLSTHYDDVAVYTDTTTGEQLGGYYGAFIGVVSNQWSTLAPYISARVDDNNTESKRVELFALPQADNQAKVRLRFAQAGTGSWYFGVDDVGLYSITQPLAPKITGSPAPQMASAGAQVTFTVKASGTEPLSYQWKFNGTNLVGKTNATLVLGNVQAANAGDYSVMVTNAGGEAASVPVKLGVFSGGITQNLVVHLAFDDNLNDSSGKNNNGTAVGAPTYATGKVGQAVHIPSTADYVSLGTPADLNFGTDTNFSIAFWAKLTAWDGDPAFISNKDWNSGGNQGYVLATDSDGHFQWNLAGSPGGRKDYDGPPGLFSDTNWHHIVVTFQRTGNAVSYVDGLPVDSRPLSADQNNVNTPEGFATNIGQDGTGNYGSFFTDADIDDLGIWQRVLTVQEVAAIYSAGLAGKDLSTATTTAPSVGTVAFASSGGKLTFTWTAATGVKLQKTTSLSPVSWQDVANTDGQGTAVETITGTAAFYRLIKP